MMSSEPDFGLDSIFPTNVRHQLWNTCSSWDQHFGIRSTGQLAEDSASHHPRCTQGKPRHRCASQGTVLPQLRVAVIHS